MLLRMVLWLVVVILVISGWRLMIVLILFVVGLMWIRKLVCYILVSIVLWIYLSLLIWVSGCLLIVIVRWWVFLSVLGLW